MRPAREWAMCPWAKKNATLELTEIIKNRWKNKGFWWEWRGQKKTEPHEANSLASSAAVSRFYTFLGGPRAKIESFALTSVNHAKARVPKVVPYKERGPLAARGRARFDGWGNRDVPSPSKSASQHHKNHRKRFVAADPFSCYMSFIFPL